MYAGEHTGAQERTHNFKSCGTLCLANLNIVQLSKIVKLFL